MATECFIFKLKESVNNDSLPRINTLTITISHTDLTPSGETDPEPYSIRCDGITDLELIGNGCFTDSTGAQNYGKTYTKNSLSTDDVYIHVSEAPVNVLLKGMSNACGTMRLCHTEVGHTDANQYITFNIEDAFQNVEQYEEILFGPTWQCTLGTGCRVTGDLTNLHVNAKSISLNGCTQIYGDFNKFIGDNYIEASNNLTTLRTYGTYNYNIPLDTDIALRDKNKLYFMPGYGNGVKGDIKWFGDTRCRYCNDTKTLSKTLTGSVNELIEHLVAQGRNDYYYFKVSDSQEWWPKVTYTYYDEVEMREVTDSLLDMFRKKKSRDQDYSERSNAYIKFTWTVDAQDNITSSFTWQKTESGLTRYAPLTD